MKTCYTIIDKSKNLKLDPMVIFYDKNGNIWKVEAVEQGKDPFKDGWYIYEGDGLLDIVIELRTNSFPTYIIIFVKDGKNNIVSLLRIKK